MTIPTFSGLEPLRIFTGSNFANIGERTNITGSAQFRRLIKEGNYAEAVRMLTTPLFCAICMVLSLVVHGQSFGELPDGRRFVARAVGDSVNGVRSGEWRTYYVNETVASIGVYSSGMRTGLWRFYRPKADELYATGWFVNGFRDSTWNYYGETGKIVATGRYENDLMEGLWRFSYDSGAKMADVLFSSGDGSKLGKTGIPTNGRYGEMVSFFENGDTLEIQSRRNGELDGTFRSFYSNGNPWLTGSYDMGKKQGAWKEYGPSGRLTEEQEYVAGELVGTSRSFDRNTGKLISEEFRIGHVLQWQKTYSQSGSLREFVEYDHGRERAHKVTWYADSRRKESEQWWIIQGERLDPGYMDRDSLYLEWHRNGAMRTEAHYVKGRLDGAYVEFFPDGKIQKQASYRKGSLEGYYQEWNPENRMPACEGNYLRGQKDGLWKEWTREGKNYSEGRYQEGRKRGEWREPETFDLIDDPDAYKLCMYDDEGDEEGRITVFDGHGRKRVEGEMHDGFPIGRWTRWFPDGTIQSETDKGNRFTGETPCEWERVLNLRDSSGEQLVKDGYGHVRQVQDGVLLREEFYKSGCRDSVWVTYEDKAVLRDVTIYEHGKEASSRSLFNDRIGGPNGIEKPTEADRLFLKLLRDRFASFAWQPRGKGIRVAVVEDRSKGSPRPGDLVEFKRIVISSLGEVQRDFDFDEVYDTDLIEGSTLTSRPELIGLRKKDLAYGQLVAIEYDAKAVPEELIRRPPINNAATYYVVFQLSRTE